MADYQTVYFESAGVPSTGLAPTWNSLYDVSDGSAYTQPAISEIGGGWYKYTLDPADFVHVAGVVDGGAALANADRYKVQEVRYSSLSQKEHKDIVVVPVYDEDTATITFTAFMLVNGERVTTGLTSITLVGYDEDHVQQFSESASSFTNGVAILSTNDPTITKNKGYYIQATVVTDLGTYVGLVSYLALE